VEEAAHAELRRNGTSVKVGELAKEEEAFVDFLACECLDALGAKALDREGAMTLP